MAKSYLGSVRPLGIALHQYTDTSDDSVIFVEEQNSKKPVFIFNNDTELFFVDKQNVKTHIGKVKYGREWIIRFVFDLKFFDNHELLCPMAFKTPDKEFIEAERFVIEKLVREHNNIFNLSAN
jgi:hypothetical protein